MLIYRGKDAVRIMDTVRSIGVVMFQGKYVAGVESTITDSITRCEPSTIDAELKYRKTIC